MKKLPQGIGSNGIIERSQVVMAVENGVEVIGVECKATDDQQAIIDYFNSRTDGSRMLSRADINPFDLAEFLPRVTLFDVELDKKGGLQELTFRLVGTDLVGFYGEWTGKKIINDSSKKSLKKVYPGTYKRVLELATVSLEKRVPVSMYSEQVSTQISYLKIRNMSVPLSNDGENINMLFVYSDIQSAKSS